MTASASPILSANVLLLCSGGVDSIVMVDQVAKLKKGHRPKSIHVLHLDHGYRSATPEAGAEAAAAATIADAHDLPFYIVRRDFATDPAPDGASKQDDARNWRYRIAIDLATRLGCDYILTGHNADDNIENAILHLAGIIPSPAMQQTAPLADTKIRVYRPLLGTTRAGILAYARENDLSWSDDPSNADPDAYKRNAVRHNIVPALLDLNPDIGGAIIKNTALAADMKTANGDMAAILLDDIEINSRQLNLVKLTYHSRPVQRAIITQWLHNLLPGNRSFNQRTVEEVVGIANNVSGKKTSLSNGLIVENRGKQILSAGRPRP